MLAFQALLWGWQGTAAVDLKQKAEVILGPRDLVNINCRKES